MRRLWLKFYEFLHLYGLFLPPFPRLDVLLYASHLGERRFSPKSDYPLKTGLSQRRCVTAPSSFYYSNKSFFFSNIFLNSVAANIPQTRTTTAHATVNSDGSTSVPVCIKPNTIENSIAHAVYVTLSAIDLEAPICAIAL